MGELNARDVAAAFAQELLVRSAMTEREPVEQAFEACKKARRAQLGTLHIRVAKPLKVLGHVTRWIEPTTAETINVKKLRALTAELRDQRSPALDGIIACIGRLPPLASAAAAC